MFQESHSSVCHSTLNTTGRCQAFDCNMLDIDGALPEDAQVFFVGREYRRIAIGLGYVKRGGLSAGGARSQL